MRKFPEGGGTSTKLCQTEAKSGIRGRGVSKGTKISGFKGSSDSSSSTSSSGYDQPANSPIRPTTKKPARNFNPAQLGKVQRGRAKNDEERRMRRDAVMARKEYKRTAKRKEYADMVEELRQTLAPFDTAKKLSQSQLFRLAVEFLSGPDVDSLKDSECDSVHEDLSSLWESVDMVGVLLTPSGEISHVLPSTVNCLGVPAEELVGRAIFDFIASHDHELVSSVLAQKEEGQRLFFHCHMADQIKGKKKERKKAETNFTQRSSNCRRMRASLKQLAGHNTQGPMILFWASPDEEVSSPQCTELSLHSRVDTTLAGSIPPYEIFSLHDVDTTFLHLCSGNLSGNRLGVPPTNPAFYNGFQQLHPMDAQALLYFVRDNIAETRSHRFWARSLTGHNTWTTLELLAKPWPLGVNPVYFDSVTELTSLIENLARESRQYFFRRHFERTQAAEEESIIAELQRYKDARKHPSHNSSPPTNPTPPVLLTQPMLQSTNAPSPQSLPNTSAYTPLLPSLLMPSLQFGSGHLSYPVASPANALSHTSHNRNISLALGMLKTANPLNPISTPTSNSNSGPPSGIQSMMSAGGAPANSTAGIQPIMSDGNMPPMLPMLTTPVMPMLGFTSDVMVPPVFPQNASQLGMQLQSVSDLQIEDMIELGDVNFQMQM